MTCDYRDCNVNIRNGNAISATQATATDTHTRLGDSDQHGTYPEHCSGTSVHDGLARLFHFFHPSSTWHFWFSFTTWWTRRTQERLGRRRRRVFNGILFFFLFFHYLLGSFPRRHAKKECWSTSKRSRAGCCLRTSSRLSLARPPRLLGRLSFGRRQQRTPSPWSTLMRFELPTLFCRVALDSLDSFTSRFEYRAAALNGHFQVNTAKRANYHRERVNALFLRIMCSNQHCHCIFDPTPRRRRPGKRTSFQAQVPYPAVVAALLLFDYPLE